MTKLTQAFIFAAGRGERMRPLTDTICKPLVKIKNKAIIDYTIEKLNQIPSLEKIIINGFYLAEQIENHIKKLNNKKIIFSRELEKVETGGGLIFAKDKIDFNQPLLTINGDILWQEDSAISDIDLMLEFWNKNNCDILLGVKQTKDYIGYEENTSGGDFILEKNILSRPIDKKMTHVFVGLQIINPKILQNIQEKNFSMSLIYKKLTDNNGFLQGVKGLELKGKYFHIGTIDAIKTTESLIMP